MAADHAIDHADVLKLAQLSRLQLADSEITGLEKDLNAILAYVAQMAELDTRDVPPMEHAGEDREIRRTDTPRPSLTQEEALAATPQQADGCFAVPKIIE